MYNIVIKQLTNKKDQVQLTLGQNNYMPHEEQLTNFKFILERSNHLLLVGVTGGYFFLLVTNAMIATIAINIVTINTKLK